MKTEPKYIKYSEQQRRWKYHLEEDYVHTNIGIQVPKMCGNEYVYLHPNGVLTISRGYRWDGPSGPAVDTLDFMRGSLVHDAGYQLVEHGYIPEGCAHHFDKLLKEICIEDGMSPWYADLVYRAVCVFGNAYRRTGPNLVLIAPLPTEERKPYETIPLASGTSASGLTPG